MNITVIRPFRKGTVMASGLAIAMLADM